MLSPTAGLTVDAGATDCYNGGMAKPRKTAQARTEARRRRLQERSTVHAASLSALAVFVVGLTVFTVLAILPGTPVRNFWLLVTVNGQVSPRSDLYQSLFAQIERQEVLFVSPLCLLCGGLTLGRLTPRRIPGLRLLRAAGIVAVGVVLACVIFRWGLILYGQQGHLQAGELNTQVEKTQLACSLGWIIAYLAGTGVGVRWRDSGFQRQLDAAEGSRFSLSRR